jgi:cytochrome c
MRVTGILPAAALLSLLLAAPLTHAGESRDEAMLGLASKSGCLTCHAVRGGDAAAAETKPIGPAWQDVAKRYHGQKGAADKLVATVQQGTNPYLSHWKGKVSGLAMPPNAVAVNEADTRRLVDWILTLDH